MPLRQGSLRLAGEERHLCAGPTWVSCVPAQRPAVYDPTPSGSHSPDAGRRVQEHASSETVICQLQPLYLWSQITTLLHSLNHVKSVPPLLLWGSGGGVANGAPAPEDTATAAQTLT